MRTAILAVVVVVILFVAALRIFESLFGAEPYAGPESDHFDGKKFHNIPPGPDHSTMEMLKWSFNRKEGYWPGWISSEYGPKPPERVAEGQLRITLVNHSTVLLQVDGINILTDPVWSTRVGPLPWLGVKRHRNPGIRFEDLPPIDVVIVSHNHYDHMDVPTLKRLADKYNPRILVGLGNSAYLSRRGVKGVQDVDWGDTLGIGNGIRILSVPTRHWSARARNDKRNTLWTAYIIQSGSGSIYFAGDTGDGPQFAAAGAQYGPFKLALLPIGAYRPEWFMSRSHMKPGEAVRAARDLKAETSIAIHYGTFALADEGESEPVADLKKALSDAGPAAPRFLVLEHGVGADIP